MPAMFARPRPVRGVHLPRRRFTGWAWLYFALFVALPVLAVAFALDATLYLVATRILDSCYGVLCLLE